MLELSPPGGGLLGDLQRLAQPGQRFHAAGALAQQLKQLLALLKLLPLSDQARARLPFGIDLLLKTQLLLISAGLRLLQSTPSLLGVSQLRNQLVHGRQLLDSCVVPKPQRLQGFGRELDGCVESLTGCSSLGNQQTPLFQGRKVLVLALLQLFNDARQFFTGLLVILQALQGPGHGDLREIEVFSPLPER